MKILMKIYVDIHGQQTLIHERSSDDGPIVVPRVGDYVDARRYDRTANQRRGSGNVVSVSHHIDGDEHEIYVVVG